MVGMATRANNNYISGPGSGTKGKHKLSGETVFRKLSMSGDRSNTGAAGKISYRWRSNCFLKTWRGPWTWPPWVICAPAFNHKLKKFCIYREFSKIVFLRKLHKRTEKNKNWTMKRLLHGTLRLKYSPTGEQIQNGRTADEISRDPITPWCGSPLFCPCFFPLQKHMYWKFRNFHLRNKVVVYFTY